MISHPSGYLTPLVFTLGMMLLGFFGSAAGMHQEGVGGARRGLGAEEGEEPRKWAVVGDAEAQLGRQAAAAAKP